MGEPFGGRGPAGLPLGDDLLALVFSHLSPPDLAAAEGACRRWRDVAQQHGLWQPHAAAAGASPQPAAGAAGAGWKQAFLEAKWRHAFASPADFIRTVRVEREAHGGAAVTALSAAPSGGLLLSAGADGSLLLWDLSPCCAPASGGGPAALRPRLLCQARHPSPLVWAQLLSPEAALAATAAAAFVWRVERPEAAAAAGGSRAGAGSEPGPPSFRLLRRFALEGGATCAAAWDQFVAVGCGDGAVRVYDTYSGSCAKLLRLHQGGVAALQHVRHGELDLLVSGGADSRLLICDSDSTLTLAEAHLLRGGVSCLLLDRRSGRLLAGSTAPGASHHCWTAGQQLSGLPTPAQRLRLAGNVRLPQLAHAGVAALSAAALPRWGGRSAFLGGCGAGVLHICSLETGAALQTFRPPAAGGGGSSPASGQPQQSQASSSSSGSSAAALSGGAPVPPRPQHAGRPGLLPPAGARHQRCTCLCADTMPVAAGFADGRLVFWRWRRGAGAPAHGDGAAGGAAAGAARGAGGAGGGA